MIIDPKTLWFEVLLASLFGVVTFASGSWMLYTLGFLMARLVGWPE